MPALAHCPACSDPVGATARFCASCGAVLDASSAPTGTAPSPRTPSGSGARRPPSSHPAGSSAAQAAARTIVGGGRFVPGTVLLDRYRVVELLGRGGMGEVYRADDLLLAQSVALKFLPASLQDDPERLARFHNEARVAREVTHPAVCRVHDIGQADGQTFLSMEYVDGEDLASLLRRIGRLPRDKALEIARQLCAGVAAAHDKGVVHRDLKPQNVMLDGQGKVRITDFGLAGLAGTIHGDEARSGTPGYMSPEQLAGREATAKSDIYAIGLILYEMFTGTRAYAGRGPAEVRKQHEEPLRAPSNLVDDVHPAVERAILRCLEEDPRQRPPSARAAAALLPGSDPLAAALLAGETPSPEVVAAARSEGLRPAQAWTCVGIVAACALASVALMQPLLLVRRVPDARAPAVLEDRAREFLRRLGYAAPAVDRARGLGMDSDYLRWATARDQSPRRWEKLGTGDPPVAEFWYRAAPQPMVPTRGEPTIAWWDPPWLASGMIGVRLDLSGRLIEFQAVPPQVETDAPPAASEPDWTPLFAEAGLDAGRFRPVTPAWTPPFYCDRRQAWEGTYARRPEIPLRVEAAAYRGRPVFFQLVSPWTHAYRMQPHAPTFTENVNAVITTVLMFLLFGVGGWLAWRNLKLGRGDRRGAARLAAAIFLTGVGVWILAGHHVRDRNGFMTMMGNEVGSALRLALVMWVFYLALEPYVRRFWPRTIVSWTRLLTNGPRDPVVGRDALIGMASGTAIALVILAAAAIGPRFGAPEALPVSNLDPALGLRYAAANVLGRWVNALALAMGSLLLLLFLKLVLRSEWVASWLVVAVLTLIQALSFADDNSSPWIAAALGFIVMAQFTLLLRHVGVVGCVVAVVVANLLLGFPLTFELEAWYGWVTLLIFAVLGALVVHAFRTSVGRTTVAVLTLGLTLASGLGAAEQRGRSWDFGHGDLRVSEDRRFLVHADGTPFLYLGDTAWELFHRLNREDAAHYLETRRKQGFTVIQAVLLAEFDGLDEPNAYGHRPLLEHDPARPDVRDGARNDYWDHVDDLVAMAAERGLYMGLLPTWGDKAGPKKWGQGPVIFTPENARAYGRFLGQRYRNAPNVIWILGGDRPAIDDKEGDFRPVWHAMAAGLKDGEGDGGRRHLVTYHPMGGRSSSEWFHEAPWLDFHMLQSGHGAKDQANYKMIAADYARTLPKPVLDGEPRYEDHPVDWKPEKGWFDDYDVRQAAYWALFAGAFGHTYGCHDVWQMLTPDRKPVSSARTPWRQAIELPGAWQMLHVRRLLLSRPFLGRVPDASLIAAGQGEGADHVQASRGPDGAYAFLYVPTGRPVTVDLGRLSGAHVKAWWFDPRNGSARALGEWPREGRREFTPPGAPARGNDWVLVLDDAGRGFPPPGQVR